MENPNPKRMLNQAIQPQQYISPEQASLSTLGMRIRKAVAEGYKANSANSFDSRYMENHFGSLEQQQQNQSRSAFQRVPLPGNMAQPPSLTNAGSTFESGLNVSEWGAPSMNIVTLPQTGTKRKHRDEDEVQMSHPSFEEYSARHGQLQFNEDF